MKQFLNSGVANNMFNWFKRMFNVREGKSFDESVADQYEIELQQRKQKQLDDANFPMDEGVSCLLSKVLDSVRHDFDKWTGGDGWFEKETDTECIKVEIFMNCGSPTYYGWLFIDDIKFLLNHDACQKFVAVWQEEFDKKDKLKKDELLKKWGCK